MRRTQRKIRKITTFTIASKHKEPKEEKKSMQKSNYGEVHKTLECRQNSKVLEKIN